MSRRGEDSVLFWHASDLRGMPAAGSALVLQVAHPTVGAGVEQHSDYKSDPWGRLWRTLDYLNTAIYAEPDVAEKAGRQLRERHRQIKGTRPDGEAYSGLDAEPFIWVHATLIEQMVVANAHFVRPIEPQELERFYREMLDVGELHGVAEGDLPPTYAEFRGYFDQMVDEKLEYNEVVQGVLESLTSPPPPSERVPEGAWRLASGALARVARLGTVGLLPARLRRRWGLNWTRSQDLQLRALGATLRGATPLVPRSVRVNGPVYLRMRERQRARRRAELRRRLGAT